MQQRRQQLASLICKRSVVELIRNLLCTLQLYKICYRDITTCQRWFYIPLHQNWISLYRVNLSFRSDQLLLNEYFNLILNAFPSFFWAKQLMQKALCNEEKYLGGEGRLMSFRHGLVTFGTFQLYCSSAFGMSSILHRALQQRVYTLLELHMLINLMITIIKRSPLKCFNEQISSVQFRGIYIQDFNLAQAQNFLKGIYLFTCKVSTHKKVKVARKEQAAIFQKNWAGPFK